MPATATAIRPNELGRDATASVTLLDLIAAVSDVSDCDEDVLATVSHMLRSGHVRFTRRPAA